MTTTTTTTTTITTTVLVFDVLPSTSIEAGLPTFVLQLILRFRRLDTDVDPLDRQKYQSFSDSTSVCVDWCVEVKNVFCTSRPQHDLQTRPSCTLRLTFVVALVSKSLRTRPSIFCSSSNKQRDGVDTDNNFCVCVCFLGCPWPLMLRSSFLCTFETDAFVPSG